MAKTRFNEVYEGVMLFVAANVDVDPRKPNGFKIHKKKEVREACCHILLHDGGRGKVSEPRVMLEDDDQAGNSHCVICDRVFCTPDINQDNLHILQKAAEIVNGSLTLLPWSTITKDAARLSIETRNNLEKFCVLYEAAVTELSTTRVNVVDPAIKSHVGRL